MNFFKTLFIYIYRCVTLDLKDYLRRAISYLWILSFSVACFVFSTLILERALYPFGIACFWIISAISLFVIYILAIPVQYILSNSIEKIFFTKRNEYQRVLREAAFGMVSIRDPRRLIRLIAYVVSKRVRFKNVSIILYDKVEESYKLKISRGERSPKLDLFALEEKDVFIKWLKRTKEPILRRDIVLKIAKFHIWHKLSENIAELEILLKKMNILNADVCMPVFYQDELLGILILGGKRCGGSFSKQELDFFNILAGSAAIAMKNAQLYIDLNAHAMEIENLCSKEHNLFMQTSVAFAAAIDARDPYTHGHSERVTMLSEIIIRNLSDSFNEKSDSLFKKRIRVAAILHDIGKIGISDDILHKPGKLDESERKIIETHPVLGSEIISHIKSLSEIIDGVKYHHERYDGKGYPEKLKAVNIPLMAKIIAVADVYDAMISDRPYRKGLPNEVVREEIINNSFRHFDPYVVAAFLKAVEKGEISL